MNLKELLLLAAGEMEARERELNAWNKAEERERPEKEIKCMFERYKEARSRIKMLKDIAVDYFNVDPDNFEDLVKQEDEKSK